MPVKRISSTIVKRSKSDPNSINEQGMARNRSIAPEQQKQNGLISFAATMPVARGVVDIGDGKVVSLTEGIAVQRTMQEDLYNDEQSTMSRPRRQAALIGAARLSKTWEQLLKWSDGEDEEEGPNSLDKMPEAEEETEDTIICKAIGIGMNNTKTLEELLRNTPQDVFEDGDDDNDGDFEVDKEDIEDDDDDDETFDDETSEIEQMKKKRRRRAGGRNNARKAEIGRNDHIGNVGPTMQLDKHNYSIKVRARCYDFPGTKGVGPSDGTRDSPSAGIIQSAFPPSPTISLPSKMFDKMNVQEAAQAINEPKMKGGDGLPLQPHTHITSQKRSSDSRSKSPGPTLKKQRIGGNGSGSGLGGLSETKFRRKEIAAMLRSISKDIKWKDVAVDVGNPRRTAGSYASHWKNVLIKNILERYPDDN